MMNKKAWITRKKRYGKNGRKDGKVIGFKAGHLPWNKGLNICTWSKLSNEEKQKRSLNISKSKEGIKFTDEHKRNISLNKLGSIPWNKNKKLPNLSGKNHPNWLDGKSFEPYSSEFNDNLKIDIRIRDNFTCRECNYNEQQLGYKLSIHHIDYNKKNNIPLNLISLCKSCHQKTNFNRNDWENYFKFKVNI